jgi:hypothetical protein
MMAVQKPALKIPPTISQELSVVQIANAKSHKVEYCFMSPSFSGIVAKPLPDLPGSTLGSNIGNIASQNLQRSRHRFRK